jgi:hypothetical protein
MAALAIVCVAGPGSLRGIINTAAWSLDGRRAEVLVQIEGGASMLVPRAALARQDDGRYHLALDFVAFDRQDVGVELNASPLVLPVIEDTLDVHTTLKEEVHLTTRRVETHRPRRVAWHREEAVVERVNREGDESNPCP